MKIGIIGTGAEGGGLAGLLAAEETPAELRLADVDEERLRLAESRVGAHAPSVPVHGTVVDASDSDAVAGWARGLDCVVNATLPPFNLAVMRGALAAKSHYLDLNSGPFVVEGLIPYEHTIDAQFELSDAFAAERLTAVSCAGVAPGWVDLAARYATEQLDEVESIVVRWVEWNDGSDLVSSVGPGLIAYFNMPTPMVFEKGEVVQVDLAESEELYEWPAPLGRIAVYTGFMHPEMRTMQNLPRKARRVEVKSGLSMGRWTSSREIWVEALRRGLAASEPLPAGGQLADVLGRSFVPPERYEEAISSGVLGSAIFAVSVEVRGGRGSHAVEHTVGLSVSLAEARRRLPWATHMVYATIGSTPIVLVPRLARGEISQTGVVGVGALDAWRELLGAVASRGHTMWERVTGTGPLTFDAVSTDRAGSEVAA